jgi:sortase A
VIAAHRTSYFSPLESAVAGDVFTLITGAGAEEWVVDRVVVVTPEHVELEEPTRSPRLTLVTCTPFNYLGSAPQRFVVIASKRRSHGARSPAPRAHKKGTPGRAPLHPKPPKAADQR